MRTSSTDAQKVTVKLTDRREYEAKVLGSDSKSDVAVLKIDAKNLPVVKLGNPRDAAGRRVGRRDRLAVRLRELRDRRHRERQGPQPARRHLRAVHPDRRRGESRATRAGRCSTCDGEVVGINSQIFSRSGGYEGRFVRDSDRRRDERRQAAAGQAAT